MLGCVKSVESVYFDLSSPETSEAYNLTKGQDTSNCVPFIAYKLISTDDSRQWRVDVYFSGGQVVVERESSSNRILGHINVVEFDPNKVRVQQGSFNIERQGVSTVPQSGSFALSQTVVESRSFPVVHYRIYDYVGSDDDWCRHASRFYFTGSGANISWIRYEGNNLGLTGHYYVVESLDGTFTSERSYIDLGGPDTYGTDTINSVNLDKTFLISTTYSCACTDTLSLSGPYVRLLNDTTTEAERFNTGNCYRLDLYVIEFHDDTVVYHGDFNFGSGDLTDDVTLPSTADSDFSMAIGTTI